MKRYSLNEHGAVSVLAIQAIETFDYQHYKTQPSIDQIGVSELEDCVGTLIEGGLISLEPEFFGKVNGDTKVDFHFVLKIMK